ncbi:MAG: PAS domain-containing protein, partial [Candidatus Heimdallarchaeaceae archaeon]
MSNLFHKDEISNKDKRKTEHKLNRNNEIKFNGDVILSCFDNLEEAVFVFNNDLTILYVNQKAEEIIGNKQSTILGKKMNEYFVDINKTENIDYFLKIDDSKKRAFSIES